MATYSERTTINDEITERNKANKSRLGRAKTLINTTISDIALMKTEYAGHSTELDAEAIVNAGDKAWELEKARKDLLKVDFLAEETRAGLMKTAIAPY